MRRILINPSIPAARSALLLLAGLIVLATALPLLAASGGPYDVSWDTLDGGGRTSSGGRYAVSGTVGQPDAGSEMSGGSYAVIGGFWSGFGGAKIYLPIVLKNS